MRNTKVEKIGKNRHCVYCGEIAKNDFEYEDYERYDCYWCNCEGANLESERNRIDNKLRQLIYSSKKKLNQFRYEAEVEELRRKYL